MGEKIAKRVQYIIVSSLLGLVLAGIVVGLGFMISQPIGNVDIDTSDKVTKVSLEAEVPTTEEMLVQTDFSVFP